MADAAAKIFLPTVSPTSSPTSKVFALINKVTPGNTTSILPGEAEHEFDAIAALLLVITLIVCILFGYYVKVHRIYCLPESAVAMLVGVVLGGITRFINPDNDYDLSILSFSPEIFFFVLLPPIIFEAGYSLNKESFFENFGTITMYAMIGTMISTFFIGVFILLLGKYSIVSTVDSSNLMETMLFGALISAVDPVATLSIMGSPELQCDQLLYSLVFGESVLNDAIAIVLFRTFLKFYSHNNMEGHDIPLALWEFLYVSFLSIVIGTLLGLLASFIYRHSRLNEYPKFETSLLFLFCYGCYAAAEAAQMSGIMALFFNGMVLSHYNSVNLSRAAHVASEHIFSTLATLSETVVFLYMGAGVFSGKFEAFDPLLSICALSACLIGRFCNIFPLSWIANKFRKDDEKVPVKMQFVLWFAGLRGAIAYALAENMPGPNKDTYASTTLCICMFTTIVLGGFTERLLTDMGMKQTSSTADRGNYTSSLQPSSPENFYGLKDKIISFDERIMKPMFGGTMTDGWFKKKKPMRYKSYNDQIDTIKEMEMEELNLGDL